MGRHVAEVNEWTDLKNWAAERRAEVAGPDTPGITSMADERAEQALIEDVARSLSPLSRFAPKHSEPPF